MALVKGAILPDRSYGAALFADLSGFTRLTETLVREYGSYHGAEELIKLLNLVYTELVEQVHSYHGSVISFSGDAITCWFDADTGLQAVACGLGMQEVVRNLSWKANQDENPDSLPNLVLKVAIAAGPIRRFIVGDPQVQYIEALAGSVLYRLAQAEKQAEPGEVIITPEVIKALDGKLEIVRRIEVENPAEGLAVVSHLIEPVAKQGWEAWTQTGGLSQEQLRPWLLPQVYDRIVAGQGDFLAELRPTIALFLGFDGLDYDQDEAAGDKLNSYVSWVQRVVNYYEGTLLELTIGDKGSYLYTVFGALLAHENDAERAVRAGLELSQPPPEFDWISGVQIGISRGIMRTGGYGGRSRRTYGALGDEVNLAARLMQHAQPGQVLVSTKVYRDNSEKFRWQEIGTITVKGKSDPLTVYRPLGEAREARKVIRPKTTLVGRAQELNLLQGQLEKLATGRKSGVVIIEGEAGIGKSRLVEDLIQRARTLNLTWVKGAGDAIEQTTPYFAWSEIFEQLLGLNGLNTPTVRYRHLSRMLQGNPQLLELLPLLKAVLALDFEETETTIRLTGANRAAKTREYLVELVRWVKSKADLQALEKPKPLIIIIEDAHWLDSASWELAELVSQQVQSLLLVITTRPMPEPLPLNHSRLLKICSCYLKLESLALADVIRLVCLRFNVKELPAPLEKLIIEKAHGNPFFSEELAYALQEMGQIIIENGVCRLADEAKNFEQIELPNTVQGIITQRIDRLSPPQQLTIKVASVIGRYFAYRLLSSIYPVEDDKLRLTEYLSSLVKLDLTHVEQPEPELSYIFKHVITQEVTYNLMTFSQRRQLHQRLAEWYEANYPDEAAVPYYPLLAHHWSRVVENKETDPQVVAKAIFYLQKAGEQALQKYANLETISLLSQALEFLKLLPAGRERDQQELDLQVALTKPLMITRGWADSQVKQAHDRARELFEELGETPRIFPVLTGLWVFYLIRAEIETALRWAEQVVVRAEQSQDQVFLAEAYYVLGQSQQNLGYFSTSRAALEHSLELYDPTQHDRQIMLFGKDTGMTATGIRALVLWILGYPEQALSSIEAARPLAQDHPYSQAWEYAVSTWVCQFRRQPEAAQERLEPFMELTDKHGLGTWQSSVVSRLGWIKIEQGQIEEGMAKIREGLELFQKAGQRTNYAHYTSLLSWGYHKLGQDEAGLKLLEDGLKETAETKENWWDGELYRLKGELLLSLRREKEAELAFQQALNITRQQQARSLELRVAVSLAKLWRQQGKDSTAFQLLNPVYNWFSEGFDLPDLQEARELLDRLSVE
jgi:predicted ATPase/class 3 adenylate cyclase